MPEFHWIEPTGGALVLYGSFIAVAPVADNAVDSGRWPASADGSLSGLSGRIRFSSRQNAAPPGFQSGIVPIHGEPLAPKATVQIHDHCKWPRSLR